MSTTIIETDLDNNMDGDARIALVLAPARECIFGERGTELEPALETNGGYRGIDITGDAVQHQIPLADALAALDCTFDELRAAIVEAHPEAESWNWASDKLVVKLVAEHRERTLIEAIAQARPEILRAAEAAGLRSASDALSEPEGRDPSLAPDEDDDCMGDYDDAYAAVIGLLDDQEIRFDDADHESDARLALDSLVDDYRAVEARSYREHILAYHEDQQTAVAAETEIEIASSPGAMLHVLNADEGRFSVTIPDDDRIPTGADGTRDYGNADWPSDEEINAAASALLGRSVTLRFVDGGDNLCESIYRIVA